MMLKKSVAVPAIALLVDHSDTLGMALDAVRLHKLPPPFGDCNGFRGLSGIKDDDVLHAVDGFPDVIRGHVFVWQVAVNAADRSVSADVEPGLELGFHDMTGGAKQGRFRLGDELRRAEDEKDTGTTDKQDQQRRDLPPMPLHETHRPAP
jgi:hypothetical protein